MREDFSRKGLQLRFEYFLCKASLLRLAQKLPAAVRQLPGVLHIQLARLRVRLFRFRRRLNFIDFLFITYVLLTTSATRKTSEPATSGD